jgi:hypothetical protein
MMPMKGKYVSLKFENLIKLLKKACQNDHSDRIFITILTWQDGDYFEELCEEDGGVIEEHLYFFKKMPLAKKLKDFADLKDELCGLKKMPYLSSKNANYKLFYDIHIWVNKYYFCYNIYFNRCYYRLQNIFQYILKMAILPKWQNNDVIRANGAGEPHHNGVRQS